MNNKNIIFRTAILFMIAVLLGMFAGCFSKSNIENIEDEIIIYDPSDGLPAPLEDGYIDISAEMVPLTEFPAMFATVGMPSAPGTVVQQNEKALIDMSNTKDGYVMIRYLNKTDKELRVQIKGPSGEVYTYTLKKSGEFEVFPLSDGNGTYKISVHENVTGIKYATVGSATVNVKLNDEFAPFIRPNQYVNYTSDSKAVKKAAELTKNTKTMLEKVGAIYEYVIKNLTYDKDLAESVKSGYLPDIDKVLEKGKGICFDYAAVTTAMLRSQNIPTKLVVGYADGIYHAWINTYSEETGWMDAVIYFDGKEWKLMDPTFASTSNQSAAIMQFIGKGENYIAKYLY